MKPDASLLVDVVAPRVLDACSAASNALARAGIRHVVIGGLAVGANGYPRATKDVHFLVGNEAFHHHAGGLVTMNPAGRRLLGYEASEVSGLRYRDLLSAAGFQLKGSGWYATDFRGGTKKTEAKPEPKSEPKSETKPETKKPETKSESKAAA